VEFTSPGAAVEHVGTSGQGLPVSAVEKRLVREAASPNIFGALRGPAERQYSHGLFFEERHGYRAVREADSGGDYQQGSSTQEPG